MRVRLSAELDPKAKRERPALEKGATHEKALRQNPHGLLADLDLGADPGCRGGVLVQPQMHRFSSSMTSRAKSKPRRRPVNESSETRHIRTKALTKLSIEACDDAQTGCLRNKHNNVSGFVGIFPSGCDQKSNSSLLPHCQDIAPWLRLTFW